ncbi:hypothetical protein JQK15_20420 [Sphingobium sp. BHU LFT2]|uniref:hypothetical protein n=1 Tax=Sphingobium sp. BHU LFT2 TaxID=2807634 RepID=UPI001BEBC96E|nr:hypothetical protein [Sphingobium sp. BHU LFT2]MBT2245880.1 hypothetical protein [Sphingobium sp. BHU LFT2]
MQRIGEVGGVSGFTPGRTAPTLMMLNYRHFAISSIFILKKRTIRLRESWRRVRQRRYAMTAKSKFKSDAFETIHSAAAGMYRVGSIDRATMRHFDQSCLVEPPMIAPE